MPFKREMEGAAFVTPTDANWTSSNSSMGGDPSTAPAVSRRTGYGPEDLSEYPPTPQAEVMTLESFTNDDTSASKSPELTSFVNGGALAPAAAAAIFGNKKKAAPSAVGEDDEFNLDMEEDFQTRMPVIRRKYKSEPMDNRGAPVMREEYSANLRGLMVVEEDGSEFNVSVSDDALSAKELPKTLLQRRGVIQSNQTDRSFFAFSDDGSLDSGPAIQSKHLIDAYSMRQVFDSRVRGPTMTQAEFSLLIGEALGWAISEYTSTHPPPVLPSDVFRSLVNEAQRQNEGGRYMSVDHPTLLARAFSFFDVKHDGVLDKDEFVTTLSTLVHGQEERMKFAFYLYDSNGDRAIDRDELFDFLHCFFVGGVKMGIKLIEGFPAVFMEEMRRSNQMSAEADDPSFHHLLVDHLKSMHQFTDNFADDEMHRLVSQAFDEARLTPEGTITYEEFSRWAAEGMDWINSLVDYLLHPRFTGGAIRQPG